MIKAVIFDFDGLMVDTEFVWYPIYRDYFKETYDYDMQVDDYLKCVGSDEVEFLDKVSNDIGEHFDLSDFQNESYAEFKLKSENLPLMDGVLSKILEARSLGLKLAVVTSSFAPHAQDHIKRLGIESLFDLVISGEMVDKVKPAPDLFLLALKKLKMSADEVLVLEDSNNGLLASNAAGIDTVIVLNRITRHLKFGKSFKLFSSMAQFSIEQLIKEKQED